MDENKGLPYFFLGLGVGVAIGMIFAPKAGAETRTMIRDRASEGGDYLRRRGTELRESAGELVDKGKGLVDKGMDRGKELVDKGKGLVDRQREHLNAAVDAGRQAYRDTVAGSETNPSSEGF